MLLFKLVGEFKATEVVIADPKVPYGKSYRLVSLQEYSELMSKYPDSKVADSWHGESLEDWLRGEDDE